MAKVVGANRFVIVAPIEHDMYYTEDKDIVQARTESENKAL
jgi:hypothetical protein